MPIFHVAARSAQPPGQPPRHLSRGLRGLLIVLGYWHGIGIVAVFFVLILTLSHNTLAFVLLPVGTSVAVAALTSRYKLTNLRAILVSVFVALIYFGGISAFELVTHAGIASKVIIVSTTLAIAVVFEPLRVLFQRYLERRIPKSGDATSAAIIAFAAGLREEIDQDQVSDQFLTIVQRLLRPQFVALWVRAPARDAVGGVPGAQAHARDTDGSSLPGLDGPRENRGDREEPAPCPPALAVEQGWSWTKQAATAMDVVVDDRDALMQYAARDPGAVELDRLRLVSPLLMQLREQRVELLLPLVSQSELLGVLLLGPRARRGQRAWWLRIWFIVLPFTYLMVMSRAFYTGEDLSLLNALAAQVAPALRVVRLVREQQTQVRQRERIEQELRTAQQIQRTFLPKHVPEPPGWRVVPYYQPAREVGGDFYDAFALADGRLGLIIGDVTGKGIPAALLMTATRTMLRTAAQEDASPGAVLARVNDLMCDDIPAGMFVTCFYAVLDPASGDLRFANAGHEAPFRRTAEQVSELWASGMPLGLMPGTRYDEYHDTVASGESLLFYSDGLVEAHNPARELYGFARLRSVLAASPDEPTPDGSTSEPTRGDALIETLLTSLAAFTGAGWEQEDDVTLMALHRAAMPVAVVPA